MGDASATMKVRIFTLRGSMWSWKLDMAPLEQEINAWFAANPGIQLHEIQRDLSVTMFTAPVAYVWVYYR